MDAPKTKTAIIAKILENDIYMEDSELMKRLAKNLSNLSRTDLCDLSMIIDIKVLKDKRK